MSSGINSSEYEKGLQSQLDLLYKKLLIVESIIGISLFDFAFNQSQIRFPIIFQIYEDSVSAKLKEKKYFIDQRAFKLKNINNNEDLWVGYKINFDKKGEILELRVAYSDSFGKKYLLIENLKDYDKKASSSSSVSLETLVNIKPYLSKIILEYFKPNGLVKGEIINYDIEIIKILGEIWDEIFKYDSNPKLNNATMTKEGESIFKILMVLYNFQLQYSNHQISIYPSKLSDREYSEIPLNQENIGLGGVFSYDKIVLPWKNSEEDKLDLLMRARDKVLARVSNLILYKAGLIDYVSTDFRKHIRMVAIAAISARNVSHNIGSHVIPNITSTSILHDLSLATGDNSEINIIWQKFMKAIKEINYSNLFLDYLQHRNDFINHLTSGKPEWTISAWFVKSLLSRFFRQYVLINSIAAFEGLSVYDYDDEEYKGFIEEK